MNGLSSSCKACESIRMLEKAVLSIGVIDQEGVCLKTIIAADLCVTSLRNALDLLR